jgi:hypothetical protein
MASWAGVLDDDSDSVSGSAGDGRHVATPAVAADSPIAGEHADPQAPGEDSCSQSYKFDALDPPEDAKEWWEFILRGAKHQRLSRGEQKRPLTVLSLCSGLGAESAALAKLGLNFRVLATCDLKEEVLMLESRKKAHQPMHHYRDVFDLLHGSATCCLHQQPCDFMRDAKDQGLHALDILVAGFPCQPFTRQSVKRYQPGGVEGHQKWNLGDAMVEAVQKYAPRAFCFEQVPGFSDPVPGRDTTPLDVFTAKIHAIGYEMVVVQMDLADWVQADRARLLHKAARHNTSKKPWPSKPRQDKARVD